jgi:hypothetical protein
VLRTRGHVAAAWEWCGAPPYFSRTATDKIDGSRGSAGVAFQGYPSGRLNLAAIVLTGGIGDAQGMATRMVVPWPAGLVSSIVPLTEATRLARRARPCPVARAPPGPSSRTSTTSVHRLCR